MGSLRDASDAGEVYTLLYLRDLGLDPTSARARSAIDRVRERVTWGPWFGDSPFFEGEVEPCINGHDVLRGLEYFRAAGVEPNACLEEAVEIVAGRRQSDGRWLADVRHEDTLYEEIAGPVGAPNRWITLRALRVMGWYGDRT